MRYVILFALIVSGCAPCEGTYYETGSDGTVKKFSKQSVGGQCVTDNVSLSQWESSTQARQNAKCTPQHVSKTLIAKDNFYKYRDDKLYLDLNGSTGEYRKLTLAEDKDGKPVFSRLQGCFYERDGQLLLDAKQVASSQSFDPMEIFSYTSSGSSIQAIRFDDSSDWDYKFCPYLDTPWGYCDLLRNGNDMFFPVLSASQQASALTDAILIRRQFNFGSVSTSTFDSLWNDPTKDGRVERTREDYKYAVQTIVDTPRYIDQAWADFVRGDRPVMPDITSNRVPVICYPGSQTITLANGSESKVYGEVCYENGQYTFTQ